MYSTKRGRHPAAKYLSSQGVLMPGVFPALEDLAGLGDLSGTFVEDPGAFVAVGVVLVALLTAGEV